MICTSPICVDSWQRLILLIVSTCFRHVSPRDRRAAGRHVKCFGALEFDKALCLQGITREYQGRIEPRPNLQISIFWKQVHREGFYVCPSLTRSPSTAIHRWEKVSMMLSATVLKVGKATLAQEHASCCRIGAWQSCPLPTYP